MVGWYNKVYKSVTRNAGAIKLAEIYLGHLFRDSVFTSVARAISVTVAFDIRERLDFEKQFDRNFISIKKMTNELRCMQIANK